MSIAIPIGGSIQLEVIENLEGKGVIAFPVLYFENTLETVSLVTGIDLAAVSEQGTANTKVFPNPSNGTFNLNLGAGQWNVEVYDIIGRKVFENRMDGNSALDLGRCQKGVYIMKATNENRTISTKILVE